MESILEKSLRLINEGNVQTVRVFSQINNKDFFQNLQRGNSDATARSADEGSPAGRISTDTSSEAFARQSQRQHPEVRLTPH